MSNLQHLNFTIFNKTSFLYPPTLQKVGQFMDNSSTENSLFYDTNHSASPVNILNNELSTMSSPRLSSNPFLSPTSSHYNQFLPAEFSIFLPNTKSLSHTPSDCSFDEFSNAISTQNRLKQASFILENQQLYNYTLCLSTLHESIKEVDNLREENDNLRLANIELIHRISLLSQATIQNCLLSSNHYSSPTIDKFGIGNTGKASPNVSPTSVIEQKKFSFPKSISIRSNGTTNRNKANLSRNITQQRVQDPAFQNQSERACVKKPEEEEAVEFEVYNQGTEKTELCNKWQETGACPYGGNCQFAHGIAELRPVIRHPRYKTEVCRMVLCGEMCPYGHRCHFRHSLTNEETLLQLQRRC